ncbi:unnamed protein product, partial [Effrenium voratum]
AAEPSTSSVPQAAEVDKRAVACAKCQRLIRRQALWSHARVCPGELYAGAVANFAGNWVGNYPYFVVFNGLDQAWAAPEDPMMRTVRTGLMGMCSSISSDICSNGFRVLKTIRQSSEEVSQREDAAGYLEAAQRVIQRDGLVGLLGRGLETRLLVNVLQGTFFTILWKLIEEKLNQG